MKVRHRVGVIAGDLNGITVTDSTLSLYPCFRPALIREIFHDRLPYNADYFNENHITELGEEELKQLATYDQLYLGAVGDPTKIKPGVLEVGILLKIRQAFDQYVNLRPVVLPEGVQSPIVGKDHRHINFEILRENTEGLYVAKGEVLNEGTDDEVGIQQMECSYKGVKRLAEFAVERARARKRFEKPRVHFVFKTNILTYAGKPWTRVQREFEEKYLDVEFGYMHFDNFLMQMV